MKVRLPRAGLREDVRLDPPEVGLDRLNRLAEKRELPGRGEHRQEA
jgi:hypothetical protein